MRLLVLLLLAAATPAAVAAGACVPSCDVPSTGFGYAPPATVVTSGSTVTWSSLDIQHTATADDWCFNVGYGVSPGSASFRISEGQLFAKVGTTERACGATALEGAVFVLPYRCLYHAAMKGVLVVTPEVGA